MVVTKQDVDRTHRRLAESADRLVHIALGVPAGDEMVWTAQLQRAARSLERALVEHKEAADAPDGPLATILEHVNTELVHQAEEQRDEHAELLRRTESLAISCEHALAFEDANIEVLGLDGHILYLMVKRHMTWESVLYFEAFFREVGGEEG
jgi:hypothetical protein